MHILNQTLITDGSVVMLENTILCITYALYPSLLNNPLVLCFSSLLHSDYLAVSSMVIIGDRWFLLLSILFGQNKVYNVMSLFYKVKSKLSDDCYHHAKAEGSPKKYIHSPKPCRIYTVDCRAEFRLWDSLVLSLTQCKVFNLHLYNIYAQKSWEIF